MKCELVGRRGNLFFFKLLRITAANCVIIVIVRSPCLVQKTPGLGGRSCIEGGVGEEMRPHSSTDL